MRRLVLLVPLLVACSGGNSASSTSAATEFISALGNAGVKCLHREPPPFKACIGLDAGAACTVPDDDADAGVGACKQLHDGRMVCAGADDDEGDCEHGADAGVDAGVCEGDHDGGDRMHPMDGGFDWGHMRDGGLPPPIQAAIDACVGKAADADCTVTFREHTLVGSCRLAPDQKTLVCAPLCSNR